MIIKQPYLSATPTGISVRAEVHVESKHLLSREIWFEVENAHKHYLNTSFEPFVVGALMLAMSLGENFKVQGNLSPKLVYGLKQYQQYFHYWFKDTLQVIDITADSYDVNSSVRNKNTVASFFSGGVDSFYTLWSHLPEREPIESNQLTHCIFVHGFDIPLEDMRTFKIASNHYRKILEGLNIQLVPVRTNLRELLVHCNVGWGMTNGAALGAIGLLLQSCFSRIYIPSTQKYSVTEPWGSNPIVDSMLSTERLDFIHHGAHMPRLEKIKAISHWPIIYDNLRVCWLRPNGLNNCGRCEKCLRTMAALELQSVLQNCSTFPKKINHKHWKLVDYYEHGYLDELAEYAQRLSRKDMAHLLSKVKNRSRSFGLIYKLQRKIIYNLAYAYWRCRDYVKNWLKQLF